MAATTVSLALGSGGARGLAHIGAIDVLVERDYEIKSIVGCSMGALIGGIHAMGRLDVYRDWVCSLERKDILSLIDVSFSSPGLMRGNRIMDALRELIGDTEIRDLPVKYVAVATDLDARREVWIDDGLLFDAIRASIAVPTVFTPVVRGDRVLVDGGLLNPVPVSPILEDETDLKLAIDLSGPADSAAVDRINSACKRLAGKSGSHRDAIQTFVNDALDRVARKLVKSSDDDGEKGLMDIVNKSFEVMQVAIARHNLETHPADLVVQIPRNACASFDFHKAAALIELGRELTEQALDERDRESDA